MTISTRHHCISSDKLKKTSLWVVLVLDKQSGYQHAQMLTSFLPLGQKNLFTPFLRTNFMFSFYCQYEARICVFNVIHNTPLTTVMRISAPGRLGSWSFKNSTSTSFKSKKKKHDKPYFERLTFAVFILDYIYWPLDTFTFMFTVWSWYWDQHCRF